MKLVLDTSGVSFTVGRTFEPKTDPQGVQRRENRGEKRLLWVVQLIAMDQGGAETLSVTVASNEIPPKLAQGQPVTPMGLEAVPWVKNNSAQVAFRADRVVPVAAAKSSAA